MKTGKLKALLFMVVFLAALALIISWAVGNDTVEEPAATTIPAVETPEPTATPDMTGVTTWVTPVPAATAVPSGSTTGSTSDSSAASTPAPTATPAATAAPAAGTVEITVDQSSEPTVEAGYGAAIGSGSFGSDTGVGLNTVVSWEATTLNASQISITFKVSLRSYSLVTCSRPILITVNGETVSFDAPAIDYAGPGQQTVSLGSKSVTVDLAKGQSVKLPVSVVWSFIGTYSGATLSDITASDSLSLSR